MEQELKELNLALLEFQKKVNESNQIALETKWKLQDVIRGSHLQGTLTAVKDDMVLRNLLAKQRY